MSENVFTLKYLEELSDFNENIDLDDLYEEKLKSEKMKLDVYNRLLARVHKKIKITSRQKVDDQFCCFIIPEVMIGIPKYDQQACIRFLMEKLQKNNFILKYIHPNCLFISWKHWIPGYIRDEFKKQTGVSIDGNGCVLERNTKDKETGLKMLDYTNNPQNTTVNKAIEFKNTKQYQENGKLLYNDGLLEKLQTIINKTKDTNDR
jgi:hypothetical protein